MAEYRKKPVVIEAFRYGYEGWPTWFEQAVSAGEIGVCAPYCIIKTLEGEMQGNKGDYIIRGIKGEIYPCKPNIFAATYEPADAPQPDSAQAMPSLGERLRDCRKRRNQTLSDVSRSTGISVSFLSDIERGRTDPSLATLYRLANHYGVWASDLIAGLQRPATAPDDDDGYDHEIAGIDDDSN